MTAMDIKPAARYGNLVLVPYGLLIYWANIPMLRKARFSILAAIYNQVTCM